MTNRQGPDHGTTYTNNADIADQFNKSFINFGPLLASYETKIQL